MDVVMDDAWMDGVMRGTIVADNAFGTAVLYIVLT